MKPSAALQPLTMGGTPSPITHNLSHHPPRPSTTKSLRPQLLHKALSLICRMARSLEMGKSGVSPLFLHKYTWRFAFCLLMLGLTMVPEWLDMEA